MMLLIPAVHEKLNLIDICYFAMCGVLFYAFTRQSKT